MAITSILLQKENQCTLKTDGIDVGLESKNCNSAIGRFGASLTGTHILKYDRQFGPLEQERSNLSVFPNDQVIQCWRHRVSLDWDLAAFSRTSANQFSSRYTDQNTTYDPAANSVLAARDVKAYSLWDLTGNSAISKQLKLRAGVLNLASTPPRFSNQPYYFLAIYDPTYTEYRRSPAPTSIFG